MREYLKITASGLIVALAVVPAMAQTGGRPQSEQQAPRNPSATQPGSTTDSPGASNQTNPGSNQDGQSMRGHTMGKVNVKEAQEALKAQGHDPGPIDGVMGPQTRDALRSYQRAQNLTETGRLDAQTQDKLGMGGGMSPSSSR